MGGEQIPRTAARNRITGSSPHGRGTGIVKEDGYIYPWFIPAWAGNSLGVSFFRLGVSVHPRMGGEQIERIGD